MWASVCLYGIPLTHSSINLPGPMLLHLLLHEYHQILSNATLLYKSLVTKTPRSPLELLRRFSGASFTLISQRGQPCLKNCCVKFGCHDVMSHDSDSNDDPHLPTTTTNESVLFVSVSLVLLRPALTMLTIGGLLSTCGPVRPPVLQSLQVREIMESVPFDHTFSGVN